MGVCFFLAGRRSHLFGFVGFFAVICLLVLNGATSLSPPVPQGKSFPWFAHPFPAQGHLLPFTMAVHIIRKKVAALGVSTKALVHPMGSWSFMPLCPAALPRTLLHPKCTRPLRFDAGAYLKSCAYSLLHSVSALRNPTLHKFHFPVKKKKKS